MLFGSHTSFTFSRSTLISFRLVSARFISFRFDYLVSISMQLGVVDLHADALQRNSGASNNLIIFALHAYCHCEVDFDSHYISRFSPLPLLSSASSSSSTPEQAFDTASQSSGGRTTTPSEASILPEGFSGSSAECRWVLGFESWVAGLGFGFFGFLALGFRV